MVLGKRISDSYRTSNSQSLSTGRVPGSGAFDILAGVDEPDQRNSEGQRGSFRKTKILLLSSPFYRSYL